MTNKSFTFCEVSLFGKINCVGEQIAFYDLKPRTLVRFLKTVDLKKIKILPLLQQEEPTFKFDEKTMLFVNYILRRANNIRKICFLKFYPETNELIVGFNRDSSDLLKIKEKS
jgi:hypothetical protein